MHNTVFHFFFFKGTLTLTLPYFENTTVASQREQRDLALLQTSAKTGRVWPNPTPPPPLIIIVVIKDVQFYISLLKKKKEKRKAAQRMPPTGESSM